jgi:hypothetical protein
LPNFKAKGREAEEVRHGFSPETAVLMPHMLIFGLGYTAAALAAQLSTAGWRVTATRRAGDAATLAFADGERIRAALATATHVMSSVPPDDDGDPVLRVYGADLAVAPAGWTGYLSSTGVYGDTGGAWVDESAPICGGRRSATMSACSACPAFTGRAAHRSIGSLPGRLSASRHLDRCSAASMSTTSLARSLPASLRRPESTTSPTICRHRRRR